MLFKIKGSHWYTNNAQLQAYLENEWLNCKPVSASHLFKNSMSSNGIVIGYHSSGLTYIDNVSTTVLTPTILQISFNNVLKNHYLILRNDKSVFSLTKILLQCVFPDQEREYAVLTARQTTAYRQPRNALPHFLKNRPSSVTNACLLNIEKGKAIESSSIEEEDA